MQLRGPSKRNFGTEIDPLSVASNKYINSVQNGSPGKVANLVQDVIQYRKRSLSGSGSYIGKNRVDTQLDKENIKSDKREKQDLNILKPILSEKQVLSKRKNPVGLVEKATKKEIANKHIENSQFSSITLNEAFSLARKAFSQNTALNAITLAKLFESSRPEQWKTLDTFFKNYLDNSFQNLEKHPTMMILRGPPGTGKSAMLRSYIELEEEYFLSDNRAKMLWINGMTLVTGTGTGSTKTFRNTSSTGDGLFLFKKLAKEWLGDVPNKILTFEGLVDALYTFIMNTDTCHILVLDELDVLLKQQQSSLTFAIHLLNKWGTERAQLNEKKAQLKENQSKKKKTLVRHIPRNFGGLLLVGLTNALHFELLQSDESDPSCLCMLDFHPYGVTELVTILKGRLQGMLTASAILADFFTNSALECIARKTANLGDIRGTFALAAASLLFSEKEHLANKENIHALSLTGNYSSHEGCNNSIECNHISGIVTIKHVQQAIISQKSGQQPSNTSGTSNPTDLVSSCPLQQQVVLAALLGSICQKSPTSIRQHASSCISSFEQLYSQYHDIFLENPALAATFPVILTRHELLDTLVLLEGRFSGLLVRLVNQTNSNKSFSTSLTSPKGILPAVQLILDRDTLKSALMGVSVLQQVMTNLHSSKKYL